MAESTDAIRNELKQERKYVLQFKVHIFYICALSYSVCLVSHIFIYCRLICTVDTKHKTELRNRFSFFGAAISL